MHNRTSFGIHPAALLHPYFALACLTVSNMWCRRCCMQQQQWDYLPRRPTSLDKLTDIREWDVVSSHTQKIGTQATVKPTPWREQKERNKRQRDRENENKKCRRTNLPSFVGIRFWTSISPFELRSKMFTERCQRPLACTTPLLSWPITRELLSSKTSNISFAVGPSMKVAIVCKLQEDKCYFNLREKRRVRNRECPTKEDGCWKAGKAAKPSLQPEWWMYSFQEA